MSRNLVFEVQEAGTTRTGDRALGAPQFSPAVVTRRGVGHSPHPSFPLRCISLSSRLCVLGSSPSSFVSPRIILGFRFKPRKPAWFPFRAQKTSLLSRLCVYVFPA